MDSDQLDISDLVNEVLEDQQKQNNYGTIDSNTKNVFRTLPQKDDDIFGNSLAMPR